MARQPASTWLQSMRRPTLLGMMTIWKSSANAILLSPTSHISLDGCVAPSLKQPVQSLSRCVLYHFGQNTCGVQRVLIRCVGASPASGGAGGSSRRRALTTHRVGGRARHTLIGNVKVRELRSACTGSVVPACCWGGILSTFCVPPCPAAQNQEPAF